MKKLILAILLLTSTSFATVDYTKADDALKKWTDNKVMIAMIQEKADNAIKELLSIVQEQAKEINKVEKEEKE